MNISFKKMYRESPKYCNKKSTLDSKIKITVDLLI